jgi:hypothetical protein
MPDATYQPGVYRAQGGNNLVIGVTGGITLDEGGNMMRVLRTRVTAAAASAGATLLAAVAGKAYRLHDIALIAIGGTVTASTTVDILGTQSTSKKLYAGTAANLTQSLLLRAGATGGTILADGASFAACDANTAITIGVTGSAIATATHVDVLLTYTLEG